MGSVEASLAGPKRPQDRVALTDVPKAFAASNELEVNVAQKDHRPGRLCSERTSVSASGRRGCDCGHYLLYQHLEPQRINGGRSAGEKAVELGLKPQPWVKASLAPGSKVVSDYLAQAKLTPYLDELGFNLVGYGCTTCIGNSGPLPEPIETAIKQGDLTVGAVLSGNRNFEGRIHPLVKTNWLASPPLVVAYALAGNMNINLVTDPIGHDRKNDPVYLKDIWPSSREIALAVEQVSTEMFRKEYAEVFEGTPEWKAINVEGRIPTTGRMTRPIFVCRRSLMRCRPSRRRLRISTARASWPCWGIPSPRTISLRRGASKPIARQAVICKAGVWNAAILTPTVRAAVTMKS
jgi:aconitate hydratase